jgi:putative ABC transport system ATP-binding protein
VKHLFEFAGIRKSFDQGDHYLKASAYVNAGETLAVTGPSGVGKSTLLKILCRLVAPDQGEMALDGISFRSVASPKWRTQVQYLAQKPALLEGTVESNLRRPFQLKQISSVMSFDLHRAEQLMEELGLSREMMQQPAFTLSGGEGARVALIRAMLLNPRVLLLDEPTASLDELSRHMVLSVLARWVQEEERALILVSHNQQDRCEISGSRQLPLQINKGGA